MKTTWKKGMAGAAMASIVLLQTLSFTGCGDTKSATVELPDAVENFALDFESGDFSFDFQDTAKQFYVRVYEQGSVDGDMPVAARRVRYRSEETAYSGSMDLSTLKPGDTYDACVYTYVKDENGDLVYNTCDTVSGVYRTNYKTPTKGIQCTIEEGMVTVTLNSDFFSDQYLDKEPTYKLRFFENGQEVATKELGAADIEEVEEESAGGWGPPTTTIIRTAVATFEATNSDAEYGVTVSVLSNDETAYYDSQESELVIATEPVEEPEGGEMGEGPMGEGQMGESPMGEDQMGEDQMGDFGGFGDEAPEGFSAPQ